MEEKNIGNNIERLIDILDKKIELMGEIHNIVVNQRTMIQSGEECFELLKETGKMVKEKTLKVNSLDESFQEEYDKISALLSASSKDYKGYITLLKEKIKICTELKLKIKLQEETNKNSLDEK